MKNLLLIINPTAGKMKSKTALFDVIDTFCKFDYNVTIKITQYKNHGTELASKAAKSGNYDLIVACGGDGTLNNVINGILSVNGNIPLGYIPTGSTNDFANSAKLPLSPKKCAEIIVKNEKHPIDMGCFNGRYFSYIASFGAFTATSYQTPQATKNTLGHLAYVLEGLKDIAQIKPYDVKITADGQCFEGNYIFGAVSNSTSIGGILKFGDDLVQLNDGLFETLLIKKPVTPMDLQQLLFGLSYSDFKNKNVFDFFKAKTLTIETKHKFDWSLDGEHQKGEQKIEISNVHSAINLLK